MKMQTLQSLCEHFVVCILIEILEWRKKKIKQWIVNIEYWIQQLNIIDIKV